jgi:hypothetical protein
MSATRENGFDGASDLETLDPLSGEGFAAEAKRTRHKRSGGQRKLIAAAVASAVVLFASGVFVGFAIRQAGRDAAGPSVTGPPTTDLGYAVAAISQFGSEVTTICAAAYHRLQEETTARGGEPNNRAWGEAASRLLQETLPELRALVPPDLIRDLWESAYSVLARLPDAWRGPDHSAAPEIIHHVEGQFGLMDCTMGAPR